MSRFKRRRTSYGRRRSRSTLYLRRTRRPRRNYGRSYKRSATATFRCRRSFNNFNLQGSVAYQPWLSTSPYYGVNTYRLADVGVNSAAALSKLTNMYAQYKVKWVKLQFKLRSSVDSSTGGTLQAVRPRLYWSSTPNGVSTNLYPASIGDIMENGSFQTRILDSERPVTVFVRPKMSQGVYQTGVTSAYASSTGWVDSEYPNVEYYGLQLAVDTHADTNQYIDCITTYGLEFRGLR